MQNSSKLYKALDERVLVLDGAMGSLIQAYKLTEEDFRGERFRNFHKDVKGNNDLLCITKPEVIREIHGRYLDAGADIIETDTFNANGISMEDYDMVQYVYEMNLAAANSTEHCGRIFGKKSREVSLRCRLHRTHEQNRIHVARCGRPGVSCSEFRRCGFGLHSTNQRFIGRRRGYFTRGNHFRHIECQSRVICRAARS